VGLRKPGPHEDIGKDLVHTTLLDNKVFLLLTVTPVMSSGSIVPILSARGVLRLFRQRFHGNMN
jgi:hypothetical protein